MVDGLGFALIVAAIVLAIAAGAASYWAGLAGLDYVRQYGVRTGAAETLFPVRLEEIEKRYGRRPWLWFLEGPGRTWRTLEIAATRVVDPELEGLRRRYQFRRRIQIAA